ADWSTISVGAAGDHGERKEGHRHRTLRTLRRGPLRRQRTEEDGTNTTTRRYKERDMTRPTIRSLKWAALALALIIPAGAATHVLAQNPTPPGAATGLGQLSGLLPRDHLT